MNSFIKQRDYREQIRWHLKELYNVPDVEKISVIVNSFIPKDMLYKSVIVAQQLPNSSQFKIIKNRYGATETIVDVDEFSIYLTQKIKYFTY